MLILSVGRKIFRALEIIFAIFLWFDWQFLLSHFCYKQYKDQKSWLDKYFFHKIALEFLTRIISSARIILLQTVFKIIIEICSTKGVEFYSPETRKADSSRESIAVPLILEVLIWHLKVRIFPDDMIFSSRIKLSFWMWSSQRILHFALKEWVTRIGLNSLPRCVMK